MTSPFAWKNQPSKFARELQLDEVRRRCALERLANPTDKRAFHVFQKAVPSESRDPNPQA